MKSMVKQRANGELTYDENGYKRRAACVVFRDEREEEVSECLLHAGKVTVLIVVVCLYFLQFHMRLDNQVTRTSCTTGVLAR